MPLFSIRLLKILNSKLLVLVTCENYYTHVITCFWKRPHFNIPQVDRNYQLVTERTREVWLTFRNLNNSLLLNTIAYTTADNVGPVSTCPPHSTLRHMPCTVFVRISYLILSVSHVVTLRPRSVPFSLSFGLNHDDASPPSFVCSLPPSLPPSRVPGSVLLPLAALVHGLPRQTETAGTSNLRAVSTAQQRQAGVVDQNRTPLNATDSHVQFRRRSFIQATRIAGHYNNTIIPLQLLIKGALL